MKRFSADFLHKLLNWEYWPGYAFYWPIYLGGILFAWRNKSWTFFTAVNPGIAFGGIGMESKYDTLALVPKKWTPETLLVEPNFDSTSLFYDIQKIGISFPLIAKPDVGARGLLVKKCESFEELEQWLSRCQTRFLIQELITYPQEVGIFCVKNPATEKWQVTSVNFKKYLEIQGDGQSTLRELVEKSPRVRLQKGQLENLLRTRGSEVLTAGDVLQLNQIGNHARGATFINGNHMITAALEARMNEIVSQIEGFDYGRLDIKFEDWDTFLEGKRFSILELNGSCSEPAHIYDQQSMHYFGALRTIWQHWSYLSAISYKNHNEKGVTYWNTRKFLKHLHHYLRYIKKMQAIQNTL